MIIHLKGLGKTVKLLVKVNLNLTMERLKEAHIEKVLKDLDKAKIYIRMGKNILESLKMRKKKAMGDILLVMAIIIKDFGKMISSMEKALNNWLMGQNMKGHGLKTKSMANLFIIKSNTKYFKSMMKENL